MRLNESEKEKIRQLHEKYKKNPFYTAQSFNMGEIPDIQKSVNLRAENITAEFEQVFDDIVKKEGRLVVEKTLLNLLEKYKKTTFDR